MARLARAIFGSTPKLSQQVSRPKKFRTLVAGTLRYRFEEIDEWDQELFFKRLVAAEFLVGKNLEPADPNAKPVYPARRHAEEFEAQKHQKREVREFPRRKVESRR